MNNYRLSSSKELKKKAYELRQDLLQMICKAKSGHTGGALSETDIMTVLFYNVMRFDVMDPRKKDRDRFLLSKGHAVECYYCILADLGFIDKQELDTFSEFKTRLNGHPNNKINGIDMNSGALGHGLSVGVGMAKAAKMDNLDNRVFVLMGDGELAEGSIWEAAMSASHLKLDNLVAIIDRNGLQISGSTEDVMALEPLCDKFESFGFHVREVDGHDYDALLGVLCAKPICGKPTAIIAHTMKGKGVSFMENQPKWHHGMPNSHELAQAMCELQKELADGE